MELEEKDIELIEAYHEGKLSESELVLFEKRRSEDVSFNDKVEDYILIMEEVSSFGQQDFTNKLTTWEKDIAGEKQGKVISLKRVLSIAAIIIILVIPLGYLLLQNNAHSNNEELFTSYFVPYDDVISERSEQSGPMEKGLSAYNQENYREAATYFEQQLEENREEGGIKTYLGISYLAMGEAAKAASILQDASQNTTGLFKEVSEWYLALSYLKSDQKDQLIGQLNSISLQDNHMYKTQADELLKELNYK